MNDAAVAESPDALVCSACEYDLRGLDGSGACPECGQPIEQSRRVLRDRPRQLRILSLGSLLIGLAMAVGGLGAGLGARQGFPSVWWLPTGAVVGASGTWILASTSRQRERRLASFVRLLAIITPTVQCLIWLALISSSLARVPTNLIERMMQVMAAVWAIAAALTFTRAAIIAREVNDVMGKVQARVLSILAPALLVLIALCAGRILSGPMVMPLLIGLIIAIFAITGWAAVFFLGFSVVLIRASRRMERELKEPL